MKQTAVELPKVGTKEFNDSAMEMFGGKPKQQTVVELDFTSWRKKNTIMLIKGGWFGNQTPCYVGDARPKTEKEWKELYEQFKNE